MKRSTDVVRAGRWILPLGLSVRGMVVERRAWGPGGVMTAAEIAKGGTIDAGGPVIANGIVYINSGYGRIFGSPGNALLAYSVDGK